MPSKPNLSYSTIYKTLRIIFDSQIGYEGRKLKAQSSKKLLEKIVLAGPVRRPNEKNTDAAFITVEESEVRGNLAARIIAGPVVRYDDLSRKRSRTNDLSEEEELYLINAAKQVGAMPTYSPRKEDTLNLPENYDINIGSEATQVLKDSRERSVPSSRIGRVANFGMLALGLGTGAAAEATKRVLGMADGNSTSAFVNPANAQRIVDTLCRVRGAALKLGQMLSLQDEKLVPRYLLDIFERVRHGADFMPLSQVNKQMKGSFGDSWRDLFAEFDEKPFAAASIGQVHRAVSKSGEPLAVKIQYPGVSAGIDADIDNLMSILRVGGFLPKGMFLNEFISVARRELKEECDYDREARAMIAFRKIFANDDHFYVPQVMKDLSTKQILTSEFVLGKPVDACLGETQEVRNYIASKFIELCLQELFVYRFMQTDPNWSNFLFGRNPRTGKPCLVLLDFGASRRYSKKFSDLYIRILKSAYDGDRKTMLDYSRKIGFLTGYETKVMEDAHCDSISILGETLASKGPFDFARQDVTERIHKLIPVMLEHRLTSPPEELLRRKQSVATKNELKFEDKCLKEIISRRSKELKDEHRRYSLEQRIKAAERMLMSRIRSGDVHGVLTFVQEQSIDAKTNFTQKRQEMLFALALKYIYTCLLVTKIPSKKDDDFKAYKALVERICEIMAVIPLNTNDVRIVFVCCLTKLKESPACKGSNALKALSQRFTFETTKWNPRSNFLLFSREELDLVKSATNTNDQTETNLRLPYLGYDRDLELVDKLSSNCSTKYKGSPFCRTDLVNVRETFKSYLNQESKFTVPVPNLARNSLEKPMEKMIQEWRWREELTATFTAMITKSTNGGLRSFLSTLDANDVGKVLLECVISALCQGQNLIPLVEFESNIKHSICSLSHNAVLQKVLQRNFNEIFIDVFEKYCQYFIDEDIPRMYTVREWWYQCCRKCGVDANFQLPFSAHLHTAPEELGSFLLAVIMKACSLPANVIPGRRGRTRVFDFRNINLEEVSLPMHNGEDAKKINVIKMMEVDQKLVQLILDHQFSELLYPVHVLPMTVPPRPWIDKGECGPMYTRTSNVLRNLYEYPERDVNLEMRKQLKTPQQARPVFDALNDLGCTPWVINEPILKELARGFDLSMDSANSSLLSSLEIPMHSSTIPLPTMEEHFGIGKKVVDLSREEAREFDKKRYEAKKLRNESNSLWCFFTYRLSLAKHFKHSILYFPHNMDFRGRVYPISPHLNHMGDDINRCLLKFARGKPLGSKGFDWLKIHCVNLTGLLKRSSIEQRLAYAEENINQIIQSAEDPWAENSWWLSSEEPWQTLSACMEIRDIINSGVDPANYVSHLPVHQDGSCNGFQHYAALGRDEEGAREVNLVPSDLPADIYSNVAYRVEEKRLTDENSADPIVAETARELRKFMPEAMPRKVIKQTVMTTIYGVTRYGANLQIKRQLKALDVPEEKIMQFSSYIAEKTLGSLNDAFAASMALRNWFRDCAKTISKLMHTVEWVTPLGLPISQPYLKTKHMKKKLCLVPAQVKQVGAFPPNFVHSLDSVHMMLTALHCRHRGLTFAAVHDCFWTHACDVDDMNVICREQFINLHTQPIVEDLAKTFREKYCSEFSEKYPLLAEELTKKFTPSVQRGNLDIESILGSRYFFS